MKKSIILFSTLCIFSFANDIKDLTEMQNFYYQKGYNEASEKFYKYGYEKALRDITAQMQKYKAIIDSYEAGKYYMQNGKITFPRIYKTKESNGDYTIHITQPEIKEKMTLQDIYMLPEYENIKDNNIINNKQYSENVADNTIHQVNTNDYEVTSAISNFREIGIVFNKTQRIKNSFDMLNIKYIETPDNYKAYFKNANDYKSFCKTTTGNEECEGL
ncbi:hypothetical protein [Campylobacter canadensis]|uniref:hypothetical protein n=1 Tax=Campylobacter canadensis TaxID=449520 RepID=UPI001CCB865D|nr:hypothetical protein [Campylobacter canadensis]MBZ8002376.1 hypothetical protein [Campylobacter canadensis]